MWTDAQSLVVNELYLSGNNATVASGIYWRPRAPGSGSRYFWQLYRQTDTLRAAQCAAVLDTTAAGLMDLYTQRFNTSYSEPASATGCF